MMLFLRLKCSEDLIKSFGVNGKKVFYAYNDQSIDSKTLVDLKVRLLRRIQLWIRTEYYKDKHLFYGFASL